MCYWLGTKAGKSFCIDYLQWHWTSPSRRQWNEACHTPGKNLAPKTGMKMKQPIETWHLCLSKADWSHLATSHHENREAHCIHYLYWQITTFWFVGPCAYFCAEGGTNSITLSCCFFSLHNFIPKIKFWKLFPKMELNFLWLYHGNNMSSNTFSKSCFYCTLKLQNKQLSFVSILHVLF